MIDERPIRPSRDAAIARYIRAKYGARPDVAARMEEAFMRAIRAGEGMKAAAEAGLAIAEASR